MDQKVEIKQEPVWLEGKENFKLESAYSHIKEEPNPELTEAGATQPAAYIKDEIIIEEQTVDQLVPLLKEEDRSSESLYLHEVAVRNSVKSSTFTKNGEREHGCIQCGKAFSKKSRLEQHNFLHTGAKPYHCR